MWDSDVFPGNGDSFDSLLQSFILLGKNGKNRTYSLYIGRSVGYFLLISFIFRNSNLCFHLLEKIIFIADYIEPDRKPIPELDIIRKLAFEDIDKAMIKIMSNTLAYLKSKDTPIDSMTQITYDSYVKLNLEKREYI